jgi:hypothetical protein
MKFGMVPSVAHRTHLVDFEGAVRGEKIKTFSFEDAKARFLGRLRATDRTLHCLNIDLEGVFQSVDRIFSCIYCEPNNYLST